MKSIKAADYIVNSSIIRLTTQLEMEDAFILENSTCFKLVYDLLVFHSNILPKIGMYAQLNKVQDLV